jgi:alkylation response protein AidB-like acyl-CoA dehydrogenase
VNETSPDAVKPGFVLVSREQYEIADDWYTSGLAGTGSKAIVISEEVVIPSYRILTFEQASSGNPPGAVVHHNSLYRIPFLASAPVAIASPALGMLQGALEDFVDMAAGRMTRGGVVGAGVQMKHFAHVQSRIGEASAALDAAKLLLQRDTRELEAEIAQGRAVSIDRRIRNRRDHAYAVKLATDALTKLFQATGGGGINSNSSIQRHWRDVNAIANHYSFNWEAVSAMYGQFRLGLDPKGQY